MENQTSYSNFIKILLDLIMSLKLKKILLYVSLNSLVIIYHFYLAVEDSPVCEL
jgi:hypothetical protein